MQAQRFKISRWICLALAVLSNGFIIAYSSLSDEATKALNNPITNFFIELINSITKREVKTIPLTGIDISLSDEEGYRYNYIPGYNVEEIPLGSAKQIECDFSPVDATNKSIIYTANPSNAVTLNASGSTLSVVGLKEGECVITAKSVDGGFESSVTVNVVDTVAPASFEISLDNTELSIGTPETIIFDIDGGVLTHDELINFRYYDIRKLHYVSSDKSVATVDEHGVIYPVSTGNANISVSNGTVTKSIDITVGLGSLPTLYSDLSITGSNVCYANDMILDQTSHNNHYQLTPKDGGTSLDPDDFIWESSNDLLVRVDSHGVMRGFRKLTREEETAEITAISKLTGQSVKFIVTVRNQIPTNWVYSLILGKSTVWNPTSYSITVGDNATIALHFSPGQADNRFTIVSSDEEVISYTKLSSGLNITGLKEGTCTLTVASEANERLKFDLVLTVLTPGAISSDDVKDVNKTIRKTIGHAMLFLVVQVFTFIAFYLFLYDKKWWFYSSLSLGEGLFISCLSELIQHFVPTRTGSITDILIDFAGVVVGAAITYLVILLIKKSKQKKALKKQTDSE